MTSPSGIISGCGNSPLLGMDRRSGRLLPPGTLISRICQGPVTPSPIRFRRTLTSNREQDHPATWNSLPVWMWWITGSALRSRI